MIPCNFAFRHRHIWKELNSPRCISRHVQLISAYTIYQSYPGYKQVYEHLNKACLHELEIRIGDAWKQKAQTAAGLVEFKIDDKKCKAKFLPEMVIVLTQNGKQVTLAEPAKVRVENTGNKMLSKSLNVELTFENEKFKAEMKPECYQQWQTWLSGTAAPKSIT